MRDRNYLRKKKKRENRIYDRVVNGRLRRPAGTRNARWSDWQESSVPSPTRCNPC